MCWTGGLVQWLCTDKGWESCKGSFANAILSFCPWDLLTGWSAVVRCLIFPNSGRLWPYNFLFEWTEEGETHSCIHLCVYEGKEKAVRVDRIPFIHIITRIQVWLKPRSEPGALAGCTVQTDTQPTSVIFCLELPGKNKALVFPKQVAKLLINALPQHPGASSTVCDIK